jgi:hypothetical protein
VQLRRLRCCPSLVQRNGSSTEDSKKGKEEGLPSGSVIKSIPLFDPRGHMMMCRVSFPAQEGMSRTVNLTPLLRRRPFLFSVCCMFSRGMLIIRELSVWEQETTSNERHDVSLFSPKCPPLPSPGIPSNPVSSELREDRGGPGQEKRRRRIRKSKKKNQDYRNRNEVCPDAPNVPETAMERRYPLCPMQKRKTACACFRQIHVRLVSWKAF